MHAHHPVALVANVPAALTLLWLLVGRPAVGWPLGAHPTLGAGPTVRRLPKA